jgi:hypothetical protein
MEYLKNLLEKKNRGQLILTILLIIYLILGSKTPKSLSNAIDNPFGKVFIALGAIILFAYSNPILGVVGLLVAFEIIRNASSKKTKGTKVDYKTGYSSEYSTEFNPSLDPYYPTEEKKWSPFSAHNQFPYTLEQEVVKKMAPIRNKNYSNEKYTFKPILDDLHDAAPINYRGVV